jgi:hypothetical protein
VFAVWCRPVSALALRLTLALTPPTEPAEAEPDDEALAEPALTEPGAEPSPASPEAPAPDPGGGFGSVTVVTTDSNVVAPPPSETDPEAEDDPGRRREMSLRAEVGYGQLGFANVEAPDHQGASLRAQFALYPWLTRSRRFGVGIGFTYAYQGFNRRELPATTELERSRGHQQLFGFRLPLLIRLHPEWFSLEPSGLLGAAFYSGRGDVWVANRRAIVPDDAMAFAAGGDLALCSVWDIVCVVGGAESIVGLETRSAADPTLDPLRVNPWGWHIGLGIDLVRAITRGNRTH